MAYAWTLSEGRRAHFNHSFFSKMPRRLNPLEAEAVDDKLITKPNDQEFVFVRFLRDYEIYTLNIQVDIQIIKDTVYFLPFVAVKDFIERHEAELV